MQKTAKVSCTKNLQNNQMSPIKLFKPPARCFWACRIQPYLQSHLILIGNLRTSKTEKKIHKTRWQNKHSKLKEKEGWGGTPQLKQVEKLK